MKTLPIIDAPIAQVRVTPDNLVVDRFNLIGSDTVIIHVYAPCGPSDWGSYTTQTTYNADQLPDSFQGQHWQAMAGRRYHWFGLVTDPKTVRNAIDATFPGYAPDQQIADAGHQARFENFRRCDPSFRAIAAANSCPACGTHKDRARGRRCAKCREYDVALP